MIRSLPLAILCLEICLLIPALDLLPVWTDEAFTVRTVALPLHEIIPVVQRDIHPPLYFILLHYWEELPLPWNGVAALRAFSVLWALLATFLLDWFWLRSSSDRLVRWLTLSLFAFSPCLLLYSRMARSYSMQVALVLLSLGLLQRWMKEPRSWLTACGAWVAVLSLLYTHYVPGVALMAGFVVVAWRPLGRLRVAAFSLAVLAGYAPWSISLLDALRRWGQGGSFSASYALTGSAFLEQFLKLGYGLTSLTIGESFLPISLLLIPVFLLLAIRGARMPAFSRQLTTLLAIAAVVGYLGVQRWVSFPFIPARLLWLLPFLALATGSGISRLESPLVRNGIILTILLSYLSSDILYFRRENYLNLGYAAPIREIATTLNAQARPDDLILMDPYNTDCQALEVYLTGTAPVIVLDEKGGPVASGRIPDAHSVWIVRNTRDISPGHATTAMESAACAGRSRWDTFLEPYPSWEHAAMKLMRIQPASDYFYQFTRCTSNNPKERNKK